MRIDLSTASTTKQEILQVNFNYLIFNEKTIEHGFEFKHKHQDEDEPEWLYQISIIVKEKIGSIDMNFSHSAGRWVVYVQISGTDNYSFFFEKKDEAKTLLEHFMNYLSK